MSIKSKLKSPAFLLVLICIFFLSTRLYKINEIPASVYWDEASIGYNAYSVLNSGKDEWGNFLPIHFRAFGEFKLPVYIYSVIPFISIFGLNELSVRIPAVVFSLLVVILTYLLTQKLFKNVTVSLFTSFVLTISPWFFIFSRTGYEVTAGLMFYLLGIYLFLKKSSKGGKLLLILSVLSFILSLYSYNSFRIIIPLTLPILLIARRSVILNQFRKSILLTSITLILFGLSFWPMYRLYTLDAGLSRLHAVEDNNIISYIKNYFSHFDPNFLFISGDKNLRSQQSGFGQLHWVELPFILLGLILLLKQRNINVFLLFSLVLIAPIPASITKESPHALRSLSIIPFLSIITAYGIFYAGKLFKKEKIFYILVTSVFLMLFMGYFLKFITIFPIYSSKDWQYGYKQVFTKYREEFNRYDKIFISDTYAQPFIFALFYLKYDPQGLEKDIKRADVSNRGFSAVSQLDKFNFTKANLLSDEEKINALIFAAPGEKVDNVNQIGKVDFLDGTTSFLIYQHE